MNFPSASFTAEELKTVCESLLRENAMWDPGAGHFVERVQSKNLLQLKKNTVWHNYS